MLSTLYLGFLAIFGFMLAFNGVAVAVAQSSSLVYLRIRNPVGDTLTSPRKYIRIGLNGVFVIALYAAFAFLCGKYLIASQPTTVVQIAYQTLAILLIYDFMYYWAHRALHTQLLMKFVHGTHHKVRFPTAMDGLYLNPLDNLVGTSLFFISVFIMAPVSVPTILAALFSYLLINNINHTGLAFKHPIFSVSNFLARKHDHHHGVNPRSNFGSIVPIWDLLFGTYE